MIIKVGNHEVDIDEKIVEAYRRTTFENLEDAADLYLRTDFDEDDVEKIFREHSLEEIKFVIERDAKGEIEVCGGTV